MTTKGDGYNNSQRYNGWGIYNLVSELGPFLTKAINHEIRVVFVSNRDFWCHGSRQKYHESWRQFFELLQTKTKKSLFVTFCRGSKYAWSRHYVAHAAPTVSKGRYRGMAGSACTTIVDSERLPKKNAGRRLTSSRRSNSAKNEWHYSTSLTGQAEQTTSEITISRAGPGRRRVRLESHRPGRTSARALTISPDGPGAVGPAPPARVGSTRKDPWILSIGFFLRL